MTVWDTISNVCAGAGASAKLAAQKTKIRADMMMLDREIVKIQKDFGVQMYDYINPLSQNEEFYTTKDESIEIMMPILITVQKEIEGLASKRVIVKEELNRSKAKRAEAAPIKAETFKEKVSAASNASVAHVGETKTRTELALIDNKMKSHKQTFGVQLYEAYSEAEDTRGLLPGDRDIRSLYDTARNEVKKCEDNKKIKEEEIVELRNSNDTPEDSSYVPPS